MKLKRSHGILLIAGIAFACLVYLLPLVAFAQSSSQISADPAASRVAFMRAQEALNHGQLERALQEVNEGLHSSPNSVAGLNLLGIILMKKGKPGPALGAFKAALKADPHSVKTHNNLGNFYASRRKLPLAEREFRASLRIDPANRSANFNLGTVLLAENHPKEAIVCFNRIHPADAGTQLNLIQAYLRAGETQKGLDIAKSLSAQYKNDVRTHFTLGLLLAGNRQYKAAEHELESADALRPNTFAILYNLGETYLHAGNLTNAESALGRALALRPKSAGALYALAQVKASQSKDLDSVNLLMKAHRLAPRNTDIIFLMARISMKEHFFEDAIPLLNEGRKIDPGRSDILSALGVCYFAVGKVNKALEAFRTLVKIDPSARSYAFIGQFYRNMGQFEEAKKYLLQGLKLDPTSPVCLYNMGFIANRQGSYHEAANWLHRSLKSNPDYADALLELAGVNLAEGKFEDAVPVLRKYIRLDPNSAPAYYKLAMAERNLHQTQAAQNDFKIFQTLSKNASAGSYPFQNLFEHLGRQANLSVQQQTQVDLNDLLKQVKLHPDQPQDLYLLAKAYLKLGRKDEAKKVLAQLDKLSAGDPRTAIGVGVLLARFGLYQDAIRHFRAAIKAEPSSNEAKYDLADAEFHIGKYGEASSILQAIAPQRRDDAELALLADIFAHLGRISEAKSIYKDAIQRNPDNGQYYMSLALTQLRGGDVAGADQTLRRGLTRIPDSGKIFWALGVVAGAAGKPSQAEKYLKRSIDLVPQWAATYAALAILYYQTGQIEKARQTLNTLTQNGLSKEFDVQQIRQVLSDASSDSRTQKGPHNLSPQSRQQFIGTALALVDQSSI